jgi:hypothetical protein
MTEMAHNCGSFSLDNPSSFWNDAFATPEQMDSFFQSTNGPASWDGYDAGQAFIDQGMNSGLARV